MRVLFLVFSTITLIACQQTPNKEEGLSEVPDGVDIYDFFFINRAPAATDKHPLDELIKIYFSTKSVAIDVGNNELYEIPRFATNGVTIFEDPLPFDDKEGLLQILEEYNVQEWKANYTSADPDTYDGGYGWMMLLQFEDDTVERYQGSGPSKKDVVPENFDDFANEIEAFKEKKSKKERIHRDGSHASLGEYWIRCGESEEPSTWFFQSKRRYWFLSIYIFYDVSRIASE